MRDDKDSDRPLIADRAERQRFYTGMMRDTKETGLNRLKAAELLSKTFGDFIDRHEISQRALDQMTPAELSNYRQALEERRMLLLKAKGMVENASAEKAILSEPAAMYGIKKIRPPAVLLALKTSAKSMPTLAQTATSAINTEIA